MLHWERSNGEIGIPPVSEALDEDLMAIQLAKELNLPVTAIADLPLHWIGSAMTMMEWTRVERDREEKRIKRATGAAAAKKKAP